MIYNSMALEKLSRSSVDSRQHYSSKSLGGEIKKVLNQSSQIVLIKCAPNTSEEHFAPIIKPLPTFIICFWSSYIRVCNV